MKKLKEKKPKAQNGVYPELTGYMVEGVESPPPEFPTKCPICDSDVSYMTDSEDTNVQYSCGGYYLPKMEAQNETRRWAGCCPLASFEYRSPIVLRHLDPDTKRLLLSTMNDLIEVTHVAVNSDSYDREKIKFREGESSLFIRLSLLLNRKKVKKSESKAR